MKLRVSPLKQQPNDRNIVQHIATLVDHDLTCFDEAGHQYPTSCNRGPKVCEAGWGGGGAIRKGREVAHKLTDGQMG